MGQNSREEEGGGEEAAGEVAPYVRKTGILLQWKLTQCLREELTFSCESQNHSHGQ